jgi:CheY-like chemotaxis protein
MRTEQNQAFDDSLSTAERKLRINSLLRRVDEDVKNKEYDVALEKLRRVYQLDIKNIYARAYEERILALKMEKEREAFKAEAEKTVESETEVRVKRWVEDYQRNQGREVRTRKKLEDVESELEQRARESAVKEMMKHVQEVEERLTKQMQQSLGTREPRVEGEPIQRMGEIRLSIEPSGQAEHLKKEFDEKLHIAREEIEHQTQEQFNEEFLAKEQEMIKKLNEEHQKTREELLRQMEEERKTLITREQIKAKEKGAAAYQMLIFLMMQFEVAPNIQEALLQRIREEFGIDEPGHAKAIRGAHMHAYVTAVRSAWEKGRPSQEEEQVLLNLKNLYQISNEEEQQTVKKVKKDLGLPDESAVILVVDDDPAILKFVEHTLKHTYQTILTAQGVEEAILLTRDIIPALILSDVQMPGIGGFSFYEKIQNGEYDEALKNIPFILMSALTDEYFIKSSKQLGVKSYITKPFSREQLLEIVRQTLV